MKIWIVILGIFLSFGACKNRQSIDNQKDNNVFDISKYRRYLDTNKYFQPYGRRHEDSSFTILYHRGLDSLSKLKALEVLKPLFQDSSDYYDKNIPSNGSFTFQFNSLVFETADYCGITVDRVGVGCWNSYYKTFFLVYKKGKLIAISEIAETVENWVGGNNHLTQSKLINTNTFLKETVKLRNSRDNEFNGDFTHIDTVAELVTFGFSGKLETATIFEETKPLKKYHIQKLKNPLTGATSIKKFFFFKDK